MSLLILGEVCVSCFGRLNPECKILMSFLSGRPPGTCPGLFAIQENVSAVMHFRKCGARPTTVSSKAGWLKAACEQSFRPEGLAQCKACEQIQNSKAFHKMRGAFDDCFQPGGLAQGSV